jgi:hypothetical protein
MDGSSIVLLFGRMKSYLQEEWGVNHVTLEPEVSGCGETEVLGRWL